MKSALHHKQQYEAKVCKIISYKKTGTNFSVTAEIMEYDERSETWGEQKVSYDWVTKFVWWKCIL